MVRVRQSAGKKGSQQWIQEVVNERPKLLTNQILEHLTKNEQIYWLSPLEEDEYAEYSDTELLNRLAINLEKRDLSSFWPTGGPHWEGLGKSNTDKLFLVEAKSHIGELYSCVGAKGKSRALILRSLEEVKQYLAAKSPVDWSNGFYQYANRLAHLYLFRTLNGKPAYLIFLYFVNIQRWVVLHR